jgi:hypothetical protein
MGVTLSGRTPAFIVTLFSIATFGCTTQPLSPSATAGGSGTGGGAPRSLAAAPGDLRSAGGRAGSIGAVFVTSQGLYYDTFVVRDPLPMEGKFQLIEAGATEFGPGDPGYLGGRWWEDTNGNDMQDEGDHFFLCPLLPPGRMTP